jgi:uncharacterized protein YcbX
MTILVDSIGWTPVKGTVLHRPSALDLTASGLPDDRLFLVIEADGTQSNTSPGFLVIESHWNPASRRLALTLPDGRVAEGSIPADLRRGPVDPERPYRVIDGPFAALLSDHLGRPVQLAMSLRESRAVDVGAVTLLSLASIKAVERQLRQSLGAERFRMSINLAGGRAFEEDEWYGRRISIGSAVIRVTGPIARCAVTTYEPRTGRRDAGTLKALIYQRGAILDPDSGELVKAPLGVYAQVEVPGRIACGQRIEVHAAEPSLCD